MLIPANRRIPDAATRRVYQGDYMASIPLTMGSKRLLTANGTPEDEANGYTQFTTKKPNVVFEGRTAVRMDDVHSLIALYFGKLRILDDPFSLHSSPMTHHLPDGSRVIQRARCGNVEFCGPMLWSMGKPMAHAVRLSDTETVILIKSANGSKGTAAHKDMLSRMVAAHNTAVAGGVLKTPYTRKISVWHSGTIRNLYNANQVVYLADNVKRFADSVISHVTSLTKTTSASYDRTYYRNEVGNYLERMHSAQRLLDHAMEMREALQGSFQSTDVYPLPQPIVNKVHLAYALANAGAHPMLAREHEEEMRVKLLNAIAIHALES